MMTVDCKDALSFLEGEELRSAKEKARRSHRLLREGGGPGGERLGWRRMLADPNDAELEEIAAVAGRIRERADVLVICGIGGSCLGSRALVEALRPRHPGRGETEIVFAGHNLGSRYHRELLEWLGRDREDGEPRSVYLNVISKSGTTLETALAFRLLRRWMEERYPDSLSERIVCTTSPEGGALNALSEKLGLRRFAIPEDVGGRFSVLTPAGLLPAAVAGVDIRTLYYEAVNRYHELEEDPSAAVEYAALRYALHQRGTAVDLISVFEEELLGVGRWLQQLLGESEGKEGKGIFPAVASYTSDLHSLGQMVQQGRRNLMETFIRVGETSRPPVFREEAGDPDGLNYLAGKSLHEINNRAFEGTRRAHREGGVPVVAVTLDRLNEQNMGEFIYFYQLVTALYGYCLEINPFNQPGVEDYKKAVYHLLGKQ